MLQKCGEVDRNVNSYSQSPNEHNIQSAIKGINGFYDGGGGGGGVGVAGDGLSVEYYRMDNDRE